MSWHRPAARTTKPLPMTPEQGPRHARRRTSPLLEIAVMAAVTMPLGLGLGWFGPRLLGDDPPARASVPQTSPRTLSPTTSAAPAPRTPFRAVVPARPHDRAEAATSSPAPPRTPARRERPGRASPSPGRPRPSPSRLVPPVLPDPSGSASPSPQAGTAACVRDTAEALLAALKGTRR